jgi:hypothetical protein
MRLRNRQQGHLLTAGSGQRLRGKRWGDCRRRHKRWDMCPQGGENHSNGNKYNYWNLKVANPEWDDLHGEELTAQDMIRVCWYGRHQDTQWYSEDRQQSPGVGLATRFG